MFIVRVGDEIVTIDQRQGKSLLDSHTVIRDNKGRLIASGDNSIVIDPTEREFYTPAGNVIYYVTKRDCAVNPFTNKVSQKTTFCDTTKPFQGHFFDFRGSLLYLYCSLHSPDKILSYYYNQTTKALEEIVLRGRQVIGQTLFEPVDKNITTGLIFFEGLTPPPKKSYPSGVTLPPITKTYPPQSGGIYNPPTTEDTDLRPGEELPFIKKKATCSHPNRKIVRLISSSYLYCPDCKADLGDVI